MISFSYLILLFYWMFFSLVWCCSLVRELLGEGACAEVRVSQRSFYNFPNLYLLWGCHSEEHKTLNLFVTFSVSQLSHIQECFPASGSVIPSHSGLVFQKTSPTFRHFILLLWEFLDFHCPWLLIPKNLNLLSFLTMMFFSWFFFFELGSSFNSPSKLISVLMRGSIFFFIFLKITALFDLLMLNS